VIGDAKSPVHLQFGCAETRLQFVGVGVWKEATAAGVVRCSCQLSSLVWPVVRRREVIDSFREVPVSTYARRSSGSGVLTSCAIN
jgi:hypothetical protein